MPESCVDSGIFLCCISSSIDYSKHTSQDKALKGFIWLTTFQHLLDCKLLNSDQRKNNPLANFNRPF